MSLRTINIECKQAELDYAGAQSAAEARAKTELQQPMLIAWYDGQKQQEHPEVPECLHKPGWLAYADGHGGVLRIDINDGEFSFVYADAG
ncbi:MAG TPA: hypothetical protein ENG78_03525 [Acidiferrobacteraceae bacterium]|nr:hypothetical protein [Acidiferrobacteraceae bacterium]HEX19873.1 hypothetical protein [Acidiferrobacteraceae bacterium]